MYILLGYGIANKSVSNYFDKENIKYLIHDDKSSIIDIKTLDKYKNEIESVIKSGSIKNDHFVIKWAIENKIEIISDVELFYRFVQKKKTKRKIIAVTGTNGKSTTVSLIKHLIQNVDLCGNIGIPVFDFIEDENDLVIELSSYMGEYLKEFHPDIGILLNFYPNHLDHHLSIENYLNAKLNIFKNMSGFDTLIYNDNLEEVVNEIDSFKMSITNLFSKETEEAISNTLNVIQRGYLDNYLCAAYVGLLYNITLEEILEKFKTFKGLLHRMEYFFEYKNVKFINDSKSTNLIALTNDLNILKNNRILLICGGKDNGSDINNVFVKEITIVFVIGENKNKFFNYFSNYNIEVKKFSNYQDLVENIKLYLDKIDVVLFSPGSQSYDYFKDFNERGNYFKNLVLKSFKNI